MGGAITLIYVNMNLHTYIGDVTINMLFTSVAIQIGQQGHTHMHKHTHTRRVRLHYATLYIITYYYIMSRYNILYTDLPVARRGLTFPNVSLHRVPPHDMPQTRDVSHTTCSIRLHDVTLHHHVMLQLVTYTRLATHAPSSYAT